jgi:hypothetical protein
MISRYCALLFWMMVALSTAGAPACAGNGTDPSVIVERHVRHYLVEPDGTYLLTVDDDRTLTGPHAAQDHGRFLIRSGTTLDDVVSVDAHIQKPDGRRVPVPPGAIRAREVVFPAATAGDRLVVHYVVRRRTPPLPGQFDDVVTLPPYVHRNTTVIVDMPPSMPLHADAVGFVPVPGGSPPGRRRYQWRYVNGPGQRPEADAVSVLDYGRRLVVSTLPDYPACAAAMHAAIAGRARASPADAALAHRATAGLPDARARVLALAEWVRNNVHVGDGNDRAARLHALLAAAGIASTPALVNGANAYRLPGVPALSVLDRTIVYVPDLDLFLDPAAASVKTGYLPPALLGKPVLLLKSATFAMTPVLQPQQIRTVAAVDVGRGTFSVARTITGARADGDDHVRTMLTGATDDIGGLRTKGALATTWHAWSAVDAAVARLMRERERRVDFVCAAVDVEDETRVRLPRGAHAGALPGPASVISGGIFYRATYSRENDTLLVRRRLTFRHGRATCTPQDALAMRPALERIRRDLDRRVTVAGSASGGRIAAKGVPPPARPQRGHGLVRELETQVDTVPARTVAAGPTGDLDEAAAPEEAGRVRMRIDRHVAGPQLAAGHVQQAVGQQRAADAGTVAVGPHEPEHEGAEVVELGQFVAAERDDLAGVDGDEQGPVRVVQRGTQP